MKPELKREIRPWRRRIDTIDDRITELLNERAACALRIGEMKHRAGESIYDPIREAEILRRTSRSGPGPLSPAAIRRVFERILDESRSQERTGTRSQQEGLKRRQ